VIKIGGNIIDHDARLQAFLQSFAGLPGLKVLVHGGGKLATRMAEQLQIPQQMVDGRRITDAETLRIITMVYGGLINKNMVASLQGMGLNALGVTGADGNLVLSRKRSNAEVEYGFVGDVEKVNAPFLKILLEQGITPVVAPITHDAKGNLLNTNADTMAQEIAKALARDYTVSLVYSFEKKGVLTDINDDNSVVPVLTPSLYNKLRNEQKIFAGMIPKLDNAFAAINAGVSRVIIGMAEELKALTTGQSGTTLTHE
jgi:acetylglutamate kinase